MADINMKGAYTIIILWQFAIQFRQHLIIRLVAKIMINKKARLINKVNRALQ